MNYIVKNINVWSIIKTSFMYFFILGIFIDIIYLYFYGLNPPSALIPYNRSTNPLIILYFLFSFAVTLGAFMALFSGFTSTIYNVTSGFFGGIKVCLRSEDIMDTRYLSNLVEEEIPLDNENE